jgi:hypothetical protein
VAPVIWRTFRREASRRGLVLAAALAFLCPGAWADAGWFESGDTALRMDLQVLNDAEIIRLPVNQWPMPRAAVQYALANAKEHFATSSAVAAALDRVRQRVEGSTHSVSFAANVAGGKAGLWRDFDTLARDDGEVSVRADFANDRASFGVVVTGVANPDDGRDFRADGSQATLQFGNWLVSANTLDRWWGPGHEGSLILSNNARPMPTVVVERAAAMPFKTPLLSWLGPWRFSFGVSQMENNRQDIDKPLFLAWRVTVMPFKDIELGFTRTA